MDERVNAPRFLQDATDAWHCTEEDFLTFCRNCWKVFLVDEALVYVENSGEIHFSILRGAPLPDLVPLRTFLLKQLSVIWGWVHPRNRGLIRFLETLGFEYHGYNMIYGQSHGKVLEWHCYILSREKFNVGKSATSLLNF